MGSPHSRPSRILTYGHDQSLLETRRMLLEEAGYSAEAILSRQILTEKLDAAEPFPYELLVICHTVPAAERASIHLGLLGRAGIYQIENSVAPPVFLGLISRLLKRS